ncbi:MAG: hypothetical protein GXP49_09480 [Deltaproteobacteria bacterium]|nr:hypothetical protein [Deltaproteobacteria bacterium]
MRILCIYMPALPPETSTGATTTAAGFELEKTLHPAMVDLARSFSPRVEDAGTDTTYLEISGLGSLFHTEENLAHTIIKSANRSGLYSLAAGIASGKILARLAAEYAVTNGKRITIFAPGKEAKQISAIPVQILVNASCIKPDERRELLGILHGLGIETAGQLALISSRSAGSRLGRRGLKLQRLAMGLDDTPLVTSMEDVEIKESIEFEPPVHTLEPISFRLRPCVERICKQLARRTLAAAKIILWIHLEQGKIQHREIDPGLPLTEPNAMLEQIRLELETSPPQDAVERLDVSIGTERFRPSQADMFKPSGPRPSSLASLLSRLDSILGKGKATAALPSNCHAYDRFETVLFRAQKQGPNTKSGAFGPMLRAYRPPLDARVITYLGVPRHVTAGMLHDPVSSASGPFRFHNEWWRDEQFLMEEWDVELKCRKLLKLGRLIQTGKWLLLGEYD